jgi:hypothetical protein
MSQDSLIMASGPWYTASPWTAQRKPLPTALLLFRACLLRILPSNGSCLHNHYLAAVIVQLLISRSLPSNGSACHNIYNTCSLRRILTETVRRVGSWNRILIEAWLQCIPAFLLSVLFCVHMYKPCHGSFPLPRCAAKCMWFIV